MKKTAKPQEANEVPASFAPVVAAFAKDRGVGRGRMFSSSSVLNVKIFAMLVQNLLQDHQRQRVLFQRGSNIVDYGPPVQQR